MSFHDIPCWQVRCDWPGCTASPADISDYAGWGEKERAHEEATEDDWWTSADGERHFCNEHPIRWASDDNASEFAHLDHLLIHDGDTNDSLNDDGHVSFMHGDSVLS